jgi:hypothetical protein
MLKILEKNNVGSETGSGSVRNQLKNSTVSGSEKNLSGSTTLMNAVKDFKGRGLALCFYVVPTGGRAHGYGV